jgi:inorganic triphosphatase YgiF
VASQALAQEQAGLSVSSELAPAGVLAQPEAADLSPDERLDRAKGFVDAIERSAQSIQRQLQSARKDRDVVRVLCLNDKLNQVDVALRSARDRVAALGAAVDRKDADRARHEYTVLEVLNDRVRTLVNESSQCIGEETGFIGEAEVSVSIDPNLPDGDTGFDLDSLALPPPPNISSPIE